MVFYALATATTIGHRQRCKFWKRFLQKVAFIQKIMPVIAHRSSRTLWVPFRRRSQLLPGTRGNILHLFTLCRGALIISAQNLGAQPCVPSCPHPYGCGAPRLIHSIIVLLRTPCAHPLLQRRLTSDTLPTIICSSTKAPRAAHHRQQHPWELRDPTHGHVVA